MVLSLNRIWIRFGLYMAAIVLITVAVFAGGLLWEEHLERQQFMATLPVDVLNDLSRLETDNPSASKRMQQIYQKYWPNDGPGIPGTVMLSVCFSMILGGIAAFLSARIFIRPIASLAETAFRIAQGDLTVRARSLDGAGEIGELVHHFNLMANTLEQLEHERKETIAAISHELRTPLTILQGRLHALCDGVIPGDLAEHHKLLAHTEHIVRLVEDLNTLSMIKAGRLSLHLARLDLAAFILDLAPVYADRAKQYGIRVETEVSEAVIMADRDRMQQVLANLVENTIRYASSGELLQIRVFCDNHSAILEISDRGPGLPEEFNERIFDPFFRFEGSRSRATGGSGLGLAIVRSLIQQHGGEIEAHQREGGGARFTIRLPRVPDTEPTA